MARYPETPERFLVTGLGAQIRRKSKRVCATDKLDYAWLRTEPCMIYHESVDDVAPVRDSRTTAVFVRSVVPVDAFSQELVIVLTLDAKNRPLGVSVIHQGGRTASIVDVSEVLRPVLMLDGVGFILLHNHPSGIPEPSPEDLDITKRVHTAAQHLGTPLLDHIVLAAGAGEAYFSFLDAGMMPR